MKQDNAIEFDAKYPKLPDYAESQGLSMARVLQLCGKKGTARNPGPYKNHRVVINSKGEMSLQTEKTIKAFV